MAGAKISFTLEGLQTGDHEPPKVWRAFIAHGKPATVRALFPPEKWDSTRTSLHRLVREGWARVYPDRENGFQLYEALSERIEFARPEPVDPVPLAKARLTQLATKADKARRSALAVKMGRVLEEIEKEVREIRDML